jgi:hypothetical protein
MSQSSVSIWFKSLLRRNDAKLLKNTSSKSFSSKAIPADQDISDKILLVSTASLKVSLIATRGVVNVVKAQAGSSTTSKMALYTASELRRYTELAVKIVTNTTRRAHQQAKGTAHPTRNQLPDIVNMEPLAVYISRWADDIDVDIQKSIDRIMRGEGNHARKSPRDRTTYVIGLIAVSEVARAIADVVGAHIRLGRRTTTCIPSLEELMLAISVSITQATLCVAESVVVMEDRNPPSYEDLRPE